MPPPNLHIFCKALLYMSSHWSSQQLIKVGRATFILKNKEIANKKQKDLPEIIQWINDRIKTGLRNLNFCQLRL